jgi:2-polyprenyl-6-hydroxyphenyl methylase/3-demethylubiquinone-9 3-methyltransferase
MPEPMPRATRAAPEAEERFPFGENWRRFLAKVDPRRIASAEHSLKLMLGCDDLRGKRFLDVGSGSGLFSLAARRLGARVHSFDYDRQSVACTLELRRRYATDDPDWVVEQGSVLDRAYMEALPVSDIVYSWGVLHHTGAMWRAFEHVLVPLAPGGKLYIAIYNDQGRTSRRWLRVKLAYHRASEPVRSLILLASAAVLWTPAALARLSSGISTGDLHKRRNPHVDRGMDLWRDLVDWVGGLPFEVARPDQIVDFFAAHGLASRKLVTAIGHGCNELVFERVE